MVGEGDASEVDIVWNADTVVGVRVGFIGSIESSPLSFDITPKSPLPFTSRSSVAVATAAVATATDSAATADGVETWTTASGAVASTDDVTLLIGVVLVTDAAMTTEANNDITLPQK